jgi:hypothetical protein
MVAVPNTLEQKFNPQWCTCNRSPKLVLKQRSVTRQKSSGVWWSDAHKTPSHGHALRYDRYGVSEEVSNALSRIRSHCVLPCVAANLPSYTTAARAQILGLEITINTVRYYSSTQQAIVVDRHPRKSPPYYTTRHTQSPMIRNTRSTTGGRMLHTAVSGLFKNRSLVQSSSPGAADFHY